MGWIERALETDQRGDPDSAWPRSFYESLTIKQREAGLWILDSSLDSFVVEALFQRRGPRRRKFPRRGISITPSIWPGALTHLHLRARDDEEISLTDPVDLTGYRIALSAYLSSMDEPPSKRDLTRRMPHQGRTTDARYYRELLALEARLKGQGSRRAAAEIAERLGKNRATIRSHLMRAREMREQGLLRED